MVEASLRENAGICTKSYICVILSLLIGRDNGGTSMLHLGCEAVAQFFRHWIITTASNACQVLWMPSTLKTW